MTALAAPFAVRLPRGPRRRRVGWPVILSVLLHLGLLVLAIVAARHKRPLPQAVPPASVAMVFEGGGNTPPSMANPAPAVPNRPAAPPRSAASPPPAPSIEQPPPVPARPIEQPPAAPPAAGPPARDIVPPVRPVAPPAQLLPPAPTLQTPPPPQTEISPPLSLAPAEPAPATAAPAARAPAPETIPLPRTIPLPPPVPVPPPETPARPAPSRLPQATQAVRPLSPPTGPAFPAPTVFSLGGHTAVPEAVPPRSRASPGTIDLSFSPESGGGDITQLHPEGKGDDVGADWLNLLSAWWLRHRFYPQEAVRLEQEGVVSLRMVIAHDGSVESVEVRQSSGSPWIDLGALQVFRGAKLPPLPKDVRDPDITLDDMIHYELIR